MTSRVQKGSTVFRPVVKSRNRAAPGPSRQSSVAVDQSRGPATNHVLPGAEFFPPSLPTSSPVITPVVSSQDRHAVVVEQETMLSISRETLQQETPAMDVNTLPTSEAIKARNPSVPSIVGPSSSKARGRSAVPTVIATPRSFPSLPRQPFVPTFQSSYDKDAPSIATLVSDHVSNQPGSSQSSSTIIVSSSNITTTTTVAIADTIAPSSSFESTRPQGTLMDSNSLPTIPADQEAPPAKEITRKRKVSDGSVKKTKKRKESQGDTEDIENSQDAAPKKARSRASSRASSSTPRPRKRAPSAPPYDPDADPGEDLDPTTVTMAALCNDTGQGRVSRKAAEILSNHAAWKIKNREKRARMKQLMEAKKYGREEELEENENPVQEETAAAASNEAGPSNPTTAAIVDDTGSGFDYTQDLTTSRYNVQIRIGPNGETIIDEESLVVDRAENDGTENYTHVVESDQTKFVNSGTYGKRYRGSRWSAEETELFYDALAQYGENYELIAYVLPGRDRKSCKNKFKVEDKRNHARINHCLDNSVPVDMTTLSRMTGKDFSGPVPEIRVPAPPPLPAPAEDTTSAAAIPESPARLKKRSRSRSRGGLDSGVVVVGDAETFEI
ncbi:hypothetical protein BDN70DRAFT_875968 [Pholiota conissans]|uniref:Myb-like domain-containing protein n=1 Tax=Pholiota conissans TaxID=109636 RepID=A0A9P5Z936_9AGAR|nr:hypothetical protein BDN70DRAFT_875968 [Pholiota conissans]